MAQRDDSKVAMSFLDDKTVVLSLDEVVASRLTDRDAFDENAPEIQELRDNFLMALRQITDAKLH